MASTCFAFFLKSSLCSLPIRSSQYKAIFVPVIYVVIIFGVDVDSEFHKDFACLTRFEKLFFSFFLDCQTTAPV